MLSRVLPAAGLVGAAAYYQSKTSATPKVVLGASQRNAVVSKR